MDKAKILQAIQRFKDDLKQVPLSQAGRNALHMKIAVLERTLLSLEAEAGTAEEKGGN